MPREPARIDRIAEKLVALWKQSPDQRLGQLVVNVARSQKPLRDLPSLQLMEDTTFEDLLDAELASGRP